MNIWDFSSFIFIEIRFNFSSIETTNLMEWTIISIFLELIISHLKNGRHFKLLSFHHLKTFSAKLLRWRCIPNECFSAYCLTQITYSINQFYKLFELNFSSIFQRLIKLQGVKKNLSYSQLSNSDKSKLLRFIFISFCYD